MTSSEFRILYINTSTGWGGMEMHPLVVADGLSRRGHPLLFAVRQGSVTHREAKERRFACLALPFRWYLDPASFPVLLRVARSFRVNVIHVHASQDTWQALLLAGVFRKDQRVLVFSRHMGSPSGRRKSDPLHRLLAGRLDAMVAVSDYIRGNILQTYSMDASRLKVIPYGLDPLVRGRPGGGKVFRKKNDLSDESPVVGMVAQLSPDKRQDLLVYAASLVVKRIPQCRFVLAGAPVHEAYAERIRELISSLGLEHHVRMVGFQRDIPSLMQAVDILAVPSKAEAFGLVLLEAMVNGKPIVGSHSGAIPEIVRHGRNGLLFAPGDPEQLASCLVELLQNPDRRAEMGEEGRAIFLERFTLEREIRETEELYRSLLAGKR